MQDQDEMTTEVRLGEGEKYPAKVIVRGGICHLQIRRTDDRDKKNFPVHISLNKKDALELVAAMCERLATSKDDSAIALGIAAAICQRLVQRMEPEDI